MPNTADNLTKPVSAGMGAALALLAAYFLALTLLSGWGFAKDQFASFWPYITGLAAGFGVQVGLYARLRSIVAGENGSGKVLGVTGTTSTAAMISCCTHYLANPLPLLGVAGLVTLVAQYQVELFWVGLIFNLGGIAYIGRKIFVFTTRHEA